jgi:hypothetical protein
MNSLGLDVKYCSTLLFSKGANTLAALLLMDCVAYDYVAASHKN